ncbi:MAG: hypothetical protein LBL57_09285 [Tannerella sp.]|jgi:hypothetical protein|nr:hypothetical protein [Tannerella sp.]
MKEIFEFRVNGDYAHLLFKAGEGKDLGGIIVIHITKDDPRFEQIGEMQKMIDQKYDTYFFAGWDIVRKYTPEEIAEAKLFQFYINTMFEPPGEDCGTQYDETVACEICGAGRKQITPLMLRKSSIPKKDIARTIAGEVVVSGRLAEAVQQRLLTGIRLDPVLCRKGATGYYQPVALNEVDLSPKTLAGDDPFEKTYSCEANTFTIQGYTFEDEAEVYVCPKGDLLGLACLSEVFVMDSPVLGKYDFFESQQKFGVKRGDLRPEPAWLCSPAFYHMVKEENFRGFTFEVAHIENNIS